MTGRWEALFNDLEAELAAAGSREQADEIDERTRHERGLRSLRERLRAARGSSVVIGLAGHGPVRVTVAEVGPDWLLARDNTPAGELLLNLAAVGWVEGLGPAADTAVPGRVWTRLDLRMSLRGLVRERAPVLVLLRDRGLQAGQDPTGQLAGTLDRVGSDHVDLAVHPADESRRRAQVRVVRTVRLDALAGIRRLG